MRQDVSELTAKLKGSVLIVQSHRVRDNPKDVESINIDNIEANETYMTTIKSKSIFFNDRLLLVEKVARSTQTIVVYTDDGKVKYYLHDRPETHPLTQLITVKSKVFYIRLTRRGIRFVYICAVLNKYNLPIKATHLVVDDLSYKKTFPIFGAVLSKKHLLTKGIFTDFIPMKQLITSEPQINAQFKVVTELDDGEINHTLTRGSRKYANRPKWYYAPITQTRVGDYSVSIRRNGHGGLSLVRRLREPIENTLSFRFYESRIVSFLLYHLAHLVSRLSRTIVNIYFEKNANQSEEGVLDLAKEAAANSSSKNYFIIRRTAAAYNAIKHDPVVVTNFTLRSYWLMYRANHVIASEVPQHVNILRSGNKYARLAPYSQTFVFLQHGITYMKPQDKTTSFRAGREGEPDLMVVSSEKERHVVSEMLNIPEDRFLLTGMPIFDTIKYNHIDAKSPDIVTIMLTWRPYEEHIQKFTKSSYYKYINDAYGLLIKLFPENKIRIVPHPKFKTHLQGTSIGDSVWQHSVAEALNETKLLITDYSSVCYNVFYQGGGVVFYQPDIDRYQQETGQLIPKDDEYIGARTHEISELKRVLDHATSSGRISINKLRSAKFMKNYETINNYSDGNNTSRILDNLRIRGIV